MSGDMMAEMMKKKKARESDPTTPNESDSLAAEAPKPRKPSIGGVPLLGGAMMDEMRRKREEAAQRPRGSSTSSQTPSQPAPPPPNFLENMKKKKEARERGESVAN